MERIMFCETTSYMSCFFKVSYNPKYYTLVIQ